MSVAVVTGATGFIGWHLCESLRDDGVEVRAAVRPSSSNPLPAGVHRIDARLEVSEMTLACAGADVVYHLAGLTRASSYAAFHEVNAEGARHAALASRDAGAVFVLVSSMAAAGPGTPESPAREDDPPRPVSDYGRSKLAGEHEVHGVDGLRWGIVRPPGVYGPRDADFLALFRLARWGVFPLLGSRDTAYTLVHVEDTVRAVRSLGDALLADRSEAVHETFFVGYPEPIRQIDVGRAVGSAVGRSLRSLPVPRWALWTGAQVGELIGKLGRPALLNRSRYAELTAAGFVCDVTKLERCLGVTAAIAPAEGLATTASWYREAGLL